ncbi:MAG: RDD family protein [Egibacteraceae bacterium]
MANPSTDAVMVTPEAVRLDFQAANVGSRFVALLIDYTVLAVALGMLAFAGGLLADAGAFVGVPSWAGVTLVLLLVFGVLWGYPVGMETLWRGRTLGKAAMGLRVVTAEGGPVGVRHAAIRAALGLVELQATGGLAAVASALCTRRHQRLGDLVAGTLVVVERTGGGPLTPVEFRVPPGAESYAATLDVSGLRSRDYATIRAFLLRAPGLDPASRARVATAIAAPIAQRLRHAPPPDVPPEVLLQCAAARYQQRHL